MPASTSTLRPKTKSKGQRLLSKMMLPIFETDVKSKTKELHRAMRERNSHSIDEVVTRN